MRNPNQYQIFSNNVVTMLRAKGKKPSWLCETFGVNKVKARKAFRGEMIFSFAQAQRIALEVNLPLNVLMNEEIKPEEAKRLIAENCVEEKTN